MKIYRGQVKRTVLSERG